MLDLTTFDYQDHAVRIVDVHDAPWFVAADVCRILDIANARDTVSRLDDDEVKVINMNTVGITDGIRGNPNANIVSESGLYALIFASRKPEAKAFRKWVTSEVLPALRKQGQYQMPDMADPDASIGMTQLSARERDQWLRMVRETRLIWGEAAARVVWNDSPFPDVIADSAASGNIQTPDVKQFLTECCTCTGDNRDRIIAGDLARAYSAWRKPLGYPDISLNAAGRALRAQVGHWVDPVTGYRFECGKRNVSTYLGIRLRPLE